MNKMNEEAWERAYAAARLENYISLDYWATDERYANNSEISESRLAEFCASEGLFNGDDPESLLIEKEREEIVNRIYKDMSDEARYIVNMVVNSPAQILAVFGVKTLRGLNPRVIEEKLRKQWQDKRYARKVVKEVVRFVECF